MSNEKRLIHIRIPDELHAALRDTSDDRGQSLQRVVLDALAVGFRGQTLDPAVGVVGVFESRFSSTLHAAIGENLQKSKRIDLMGVYLLDFLAEDGWGYELLLSALGSKKAQVRLLIQDKDSPAAHWRFADKNGTNGTDNSTAPDSKLQRAHEAESRLSMLLAQRPSLSARRYAVYPLVRWLLRLDSAVFIEHHCFRHHHLGRPLSPSKLPVFAFDARSAAATRYAEYFESAWHEGVAS